MATKCTSVAHVAPILDLKKSFSTVFCPLHHKSAVAGLSKSRVPPFEAADLLRKWKMLPCCPLLGEKWGGWNILERWSSYWKLLMLPTVEKAQAKKNMSWVHREWLLTSQCGLYASWEQSSWMLCHINSLLRLHASCEFIDIALPTTVSSILGPNPPPLALPLLSEDPQLSSGSSECDY